MQATNARPTTRITLHSAALVLLVATILASGIHFASQSGTDPQAYSNDFNVYYYAAREMTAGRDPYQHSLSDWVAYLYPPLFAELLIPVALLPLPAAAYLWFLISVTATLATAWMSAAFVDSNGESKPAPLLSRRGALAAGALFVVLRFVLDNFNIGQVNMVVTMFAVAHVYLLAKNRKLASALALAVAVALKLTPGLLIVYHLARRQFKSAALCVAFTIAVMAASFLPFGRRAPQVFATFVNRTVKNEQGFDLAYSGNQSLRAALARVGSGATENLEQIDDAATREPTNIVSLIAALMLLALAILAAVLARNETAIAPFFVCYVLLSPLSWKAHFVALILPSAFLLEQMLSINDKRWRRAIAATLTVTFAVFTFTSYHLIGELAAGWADTHSLICASALLVFFVTVSLVIRQGLTRPRAQENEV